MANHLAAAISDLLKLATGDEIKSIIKTIGDRFPDLSHDLNNDAPFSLREFSAAALTTAREYLDILRDSRDIPSTEEISIAGLYIELANVESGYLFQ